MSETETTYSPQLVDLDPQDVAVMRGHVTVNEIPAFLGNAFRSTAQDVAHCGRTIAGPPFARFLPGPDGFEVEAGFPIDRPLPVAPHAVPGLLPGGPAVTVMHVGEYSQVVDAYAAAQAWLASHHCEAAGEAWECYLDEPGVERPRTVVYLPCTFAATWQSDQETRRDVTFDPVAEP